jgi:hypothetical protein
MDISSLIIPILIAIIAASPGVYALIAQRKKIKADAVKTEAEAAEIIQRIAAKQIEQYQKRVDALEKRIGKLEDELQNTLDCLISVVQGGHQLYGQVKDLGADPVYTPPSIDVITRPRRRTVESSE